MLRLITTLWPEYTIEAALLGMFMISACAFTVLFWLPSSMAYERIHSTLLRRILTGVAMGLTATTLIYSPWGQRSGAHMNPSVTLTFCRLGKIPFKLAALYIAAQFLGGSAGVMIAAHMLGRNLARPEVQYAATIPGATGTVLAVLGEVFISFCLMYTVLHVSNHPTLSRYTGVFAGLLVAVYVSFESPLSGMSMNPARTFASALPSGIWTGFWIYLTVPPLAMLAAAELYIRGACGYRVGCCKLHHNSERHCIFCGCNGVSE